MHKNDIPELLPGMTLYKHKGFTLYRVLRYNKTKGEIHLQKMFSDTPEPPMAYDTLLHQIMRNNMKLLSVEETKNALKLQQSNLTKSRKRIQLLTDALDKKEKQFQQFRTHCQEFERSELRSPSQSNKKSKS